MKYSSNFNSNYRKVVISGGGEMSHLHRLQKQRLNEQILKLEFRNFKLLSIIVYHNRHSFNVHVS